MSQVDVILPTESTGEMPVVRSIKPLDLAEVLEKGLQDFRAMPTHVVFLCIIYPVIGLVLAWATVGYDLLPLLYPLAAGFALVGPFAAIGAYELSRRRELGLDTSWKHAFDIIHSPSFWSLIALGLLLLAIFAVWLAVARGIYVANFGEFSDTAQRITGTQFATFAAFFRIPSLRSGSFRSSLKALATSAMQASMPEALPIEIPVALFCRM